jgi:serine palmitoyltransferase
MDDNSSRKCINLASYNYLGFAENTEAVIQTVYKDKLGACSSRHELGTMAIHNELEKVTAFFLRTNDAIALDMGFATNALNIPLLISKGTLVISDEKNHVSLLLGLRLSRGSLKVFKQDIVQLESILRRSIIHVQPLTRHPLKNIMIVVEGVYSMLGTFVNCLRLWLLKRSTDPSYILTKPTQLEPWVQKAMAS